MAELGTLAIRIPLLTLYTVGFVDSAGGRVPGHANKSRSANYRSRSAIVVVSQDDIDRLYIRKAWARHCTTDELCDEIFATQAEFHPATIGIDASANQALFADALIRDALAGAIKLLPARHTNDEVTSEIAQYRSYLRSQNLSETEIERRVVAAFADAEMR